MPQSNSEFHKDHRKRMRKRFLEHGFDGFAEHEILELLLFFSIPRCDTNPLAHAILNEYKTLANVFEADPASLSKIPGLGENSAVLISMIPHLSRIYEQSKCQKNALLYSTESIGRFATALLKGKTSEEFAMICLDSNRRVHWSGIIAKGTLDRIEAYPRLVVSEVVKHNANNVIFVHNHPNGSLVPSSADKSTTRILVDALTPIGVTILDHMIVSNNRYYSMAEAGFTF